MKVWAFEHTPDTYESEYGLVSLHTTKQGAEAAKEKYIQGIIDKHEAERKYLNGYDVAYDHDPLADRDSIIREVTVED